MTKVSWLKGRQITRKTSVTMCQTLSRRQLIGLLTGSALLPFQAAATSRSAYNSGSAIIEENSIARTSTAAPIHYVGLLEMAQLIESKQISPVELTKSILDRIDQLDGQLKSFATVMVDDALEAARAAESQIMAGGYKRSLHGIPIGVKDLCFTRGVRTMGGTRVLADHVPTYDATVVKRLNAAGAVLLGKQNLTEGAMGGYHPDFEVPVNPWDPGRWPGASSSGSAVATAAGLSYVSLGSDTGGSIRFPAASCGVVGLKPTYGRVSRYGVLALAESLDHVGTFGRRSADAGVTLEAIAGFDLNDPSSLRVSVSNILDEISQGIKGIRVGFDERYVSEGATSDVTESVVASLQLLSELGAEVVEVNVPDVAELVPAWRTLCATEAVAAHESNYPSRADEYGPYFREWLDIGAAVTGADYAKANKVRREFNGRYDAVFSKADVLVCPAMPSVARPVTLAQQYGTIEGLSKTWPEGLHSSTYTFPADFSGRPTINLPSGFNEDQLPYSLQFVGKHLDEALLCRIGHAYEEATDWHKRHPNL